MKILLLGEYSALHKNLKEGLLELGVQVKTASTSDGWKKIESDIDWSSTLSGFGGHAQRIAKLLYSIPRLQGFDIVQMIDPVLFTMKLGLNNWLVRRLFKKNKKIFLVGAGATNSNSLLADYFETDYKYPEFFLHIKQSQTMWSQTEQGRAYNAWLLEKINGYIPIMFEYAKPYRTFGYQKLTPTIPIPINTDLVKYKPNKVGRKVIFFHGISRESVKGTPIIRAAMELLKQKYPDDVEIILDGKMPLESYLELLDKVNVVIDQTYSISYGVNAVYNLALGKVVIGGGGPECLQEFGLDKSPLFPVSPTIESVYSQLLYILENRRKIPEIGEKSRRYVEEIHDYKKVASQYLDVWKRF